MCSIGADQLAKVNGKSQDFSQVSQVPVASDPGSDDFIYRFLTHVSLRCITPSAKVLDILCVRCVRWERKKQGEREREREREREKEKERERETELTSPFSHWNWRWFQTFPCPNFALFVPHLSNCHHCCAKIGGPLTLSVKFRCQKKSFSSFRLWDSWNRNQLFGCTASPCFFSSKKGSN